MGASPVMIPIKTFLMLYSCERYIMKKVLLLTFCLALSGCTWFQTNQKALSADGLQLLGCVSSAALSGSPVESIAITCGPMLVSDVVSILDEAKIAPVSSPGLLEARSTTNPLIRDAGMGQ